MNFNDDVLPGLIPSLAAIVAAAVVILISNTFPEPYQKIMFQFAIFGVGFACALAGLISLPDHSSLVETFKLFSQLSWNTRFLLSVVVIGGSYFGAGMYIAAPERPIDSEEGEKETDAFRTPGSVDNTVGFNIPSNVNDADKDFFESFLDHLQKEIVSDLPTIYEMPNEAVKYVDRMISYTVAGGKMNRGLAVMACHRILIEATKRKVSDKQRVQAAALGWCVEFLQAFFLVADDVMDDSVTRRGQPCWFRLPEVKLIAINDSFILETCVYKILKRYFGKEKYYYQLVDLFIETTRQTEFGQLLDLTSQPLTGPIDLNRFTMERYRSIVKYKTAFYSFYLPVALGMIMCGVTDRKTFDQAREILLIMGEYFQIQDDYLDCYGTPEVIGKIGTDIQDNKCSWLVIQALNKANSEQRRILEENYGKHDPHKVNIIKKLYQDMKLKEAFEKYEEESYQQLTTLIGEIKNVPKEVFEFLLNKIYKRSK